jgi:predicted phage terminase large subunit-like protein
MVPKQQIEISPQVGPQILFLSSQADIAIYGGAAGGGKSYGLLLDPLRHTKNSLFGGTIFRKTAVQVRTQGGLWDTSMQIYPLLNAIPGGSRLRWEFPSGMIMSFAHLEYDKDVLNYQGAQIPWMGFDELTHFTESQFFYMMSRNRSTSNVKPRIRATCNPDPDSWVRTFIDWWIGPDGFAIPERSGKVRWFIRIQDKIVWADSKKEIFDLYGESPEIQPKSVTFIAAKLQDNQILMQKDPAYMSNLLALNRVDRARLLDGNWNIRVTAGSLFKEEWFPIVNAIPGGWIQVIRFWDRAATKVSESSRDPDWTRGLKLYKYPDGTFCIGDIKSLRDTPGKVEKLVLSVASHDGQSVSIMSQQDPGSAGVSEAEHFITMLSGYEVRTEVMPKDKVTRAKPVSSQAEQGNIKVLRAPWNRDFFSELENFPDGPHDDQVDVLSGAFNALAGGLSTVDAMWGG